MHNLVDGRLISRAGSKISRYRLPIAGHTGVNRYHMTM